MYISGFISSGDWYFGFVNYFFCMFCGGVQKLIPQLNAYTIVVESLCLFASIVLTYIFMKKFDYCVGTFFILLFEAFFAVNYFSNVSFTKTPALLCLTGLIVIIDSEKHRLGIIKAFFGSLLVIIGSTIRFQIFCVSVFFSVIYIIVCYINEYFSIREKSKKILYLFKKIVTDYKIYIIAFCLVCGVSLNFASNIIINSVEEQKYFREYTGARSDVWDYPIPEYSDCPDEYKK